MNYKELLQDKRWKKKRKEIKHRDMHRCQHCHANDVRLEVHHNFYEKDRLPWEYDDADLITLCRDCHQEVTDTKKTVKRIVDNLHPGELSPLLCLLTACYDEYRMEEGEGYFSYAEYFRWLMDVSTPLSIARYIRRTRQTP